MYVHSNNSKTIIQCNYNYSVIIEKAHNYKVSPTMIKKKSTVSPTMIKKTGKNVSEIYFLIIVCWICQKVCPSKNRTRCCKSYTGNYIML